MWQVAACTYSQVVAEELLAVLDRQGDRVLDLGAPGLLAEVAVADGVLADGVLVCGC